MDLSVIMKYHHFIGLALDIISIIFFILVIYNTKKLLWLCKKIKKLEKELQRVDSTFVSYLSMLDDENARLKKQKNKAKRSSKP